jgi:hypothetical protein
VIIFLSKLSTDKTNNQTDTTMKLSKILTAFAMAAFLSTAAYAQSDDVNVTANVVVDVDVATVTNVAFGDIPATGTAIVDPQGTAHSGLLGTPTVGELTITGAGNNDVVVTWDASTTLGDGASSTITFNTAVSGDAGSGNQTTSSDINSGDTITLGSGSYTLWVGGSITTSGATTGSYSSNASNGGGDITFNVSYF